MDSDTIVLYIIIGYCAIVIILIFLIACYNEFKRVYAEARKRIHREHLLKKANLYMEPYDDIWTYQTLTSENLRIELKTRVIIVGNNADKTFKIRGSKGDIDKVWDYILDNFCENILYDNIVAEIQAVFGNKFLSLEFNEKFKKLPTTRTSKQVKTTAKTTRKRKTKVPEYIKKERIVDL